MYHLFFGEIMSLTITECMFQVLKNLYYYLVEEEVRMAKSDAECKYQIFIHLFVFVITYRSNVCFANYNSRKFDQLIRSSAVRKENVCVFIYFKIKYQLIFNREETCKRGGFKRNGGCAIWVSIGFC